MRASAEEIKATEHLALSVSEAGQLIGIGRTAVFNEIREGRLLAKKCGRRTLILRSDLDTWLATLPDRKYSPSLQASHIAKDASGRRAGCGQK
jgi:excisionase family DNA binding protein